MADDVTRKTPDGLEFTFIRELRRESKDVRVRFTVLEISEPREVFSRRSNRIYLVANALLADETAKVTLQLWNSDIDKIEVGETYVLENAYISVYNECMYLNRGYTGGIIQSHESIEVPSDLKNMSLPFVGVKVSKRTSDVKTGKTFRGEPGRAAKGYCSSKEF
ncbi:MAG: hypothetical protein BAJATHORv1_30006 [Candidatus Thorarchaeota archaeon]|nr:MAG: hypothetical protein BAJATHORv1_30006 [Candidatus Thorarchaeota archaeon]